MFAVTHYNGGARQAAEYVNQALDEMSQKNLDLVSQSLSKVKRFFRDSNQDGVTHANSYKEEFSKEIIVGQMRRFFEKIERELPD